MIKQPKIEHSMEHIDLWIRFKLLQVKRHLLFTYGCNICNITPLTFPINFVYFTWFWFTVFFCVWFLIFGESRIFGFLFDIFQFDTIFFWFKYVNITDMKDREKEKYIDICMYIVYVYINLTILVEAGGKCYKWLEINLKYLKTKRKIKNFHWNWRRIKGSLHLKFVFFCNFSYMLFVVLVCTIFPIEIVLC